ncbi:hypothetical protein RN001_005546 [Aquatica leii]|uniref:Uncharacterized protein n=1 Tax=Aquatica leii TaxID=1421715 RepID=A0AAN7SHW8_9COLE|nr:hypothetical protein RN001_005546 [Aquatica leii]
MIIVIIPPPPHEDIVSSVHENFNNAQVLPPVGSVLSNEAVCTLLQNIHVILVKCDLVLQSHTDRLIAIEKKLNIAPIHDVVVLSSELPLKTVNSIELFEQSLDDGQSAALDLHSLNINKFIDLDFNDINVAEILIKYKDNFQYVLKLLSMILVELKDIKQRILIRLVNHL